MHSQNGCSNGTVATQCGLPLAKRPFIVSGSMLLSANSDYHNSLGYLWVSTVAGSIQHNHRLCSLHQTIYTSRLNSTQIDPGVENVWKTAFVTRAKLLASQHVFTSHFQLPCCRCQKPAAANQGYVGARAARLVTACLLRGAMLYMFHTTALVFLLQMGMLDNFRNGYQYTFGFKCMKTCSLIGRCS